MSNADTLWFPETIECSTCQTSEAAFVGRLGGADSKTGIYECLDPNCYAETEFEGAPAEADL